MEIFATDSVIQKIKLKHNVKLQEVEEAFFLHDGVFLIDNREENATDPQTVWFISETAEGRLLKVVIIPLINKNIAILRTAYEPDTQEVEYYEKRNR